MRLLPVEGRFDPDTTLGYLARHAVPGVEVVDRADRSLTRLIPHFGNRGPIRIRLAPNGVELRLLASDDDPPPELISLVRGWFDLDADLARIGAVLDRDPSLAAAGHAFPAVRIIGFPDGFEAAVTTVLGQQVSLAAMRTFAGRLGRFYRQPRRGGPDDLPDSQPAGSRAGRRASCRDRRHRSTSSDAARRGCSLRRRLHPRPVEPSRRGPCDAARAARSRSMDGGVPGDAGAARRRRLPRQRSCTAPRGRRPSRPPTY